MAGKTVAAGEVLKVLERDRFYWGGRGGVTFSGGEPLQQPVFLRLLLEACRLAQIHTAVETSGQCAGDTLAGVLPWIDWLFFDIKHLDGDAHRLGTGMDNRQILENLEAVRRSGWPGRLMIRLTVVPGFNDSGGHLRRLAAFLGDLGIKEINLLPLHRLGQSKYRQLGLEDRSAGIAPPTARQMDQAAAVFLSHGLQCHVGSNTPF